MELQRKKSNRKKTENPKTLWNNTWEYMLFIVGSKIKICLAVLCKLFQVSARRLRVIQKKALHNETFEERRGSHDNRPHKLESNVWVKLKEHLSMIPSAKSHYSGSKTNLNYFENPHLNVKTFEMVIFERKMCHSRDSNHISSFPYWHPSHCGMLTN